MLEGVGRRGRPERMHADLEPELLGIAAHQLVDPVGRHCLVEAALRVLHGPEERQGLASLPLQVVGKQLLAAGVQGDMAQLVALAAHPQVHHATPLVDIPEGELRELLAPQPVMQEQGEEGAIAQPLRGIDRCFQELARLGITDRRRLALVALHLRPLNALDRVVGDRIGLGEVFEQGGEGGELAPDRGSGQLAPLEILAPGEHVGPGDQAQLRRRRDANKAHEFLQVILVGAAGVGVIEIREPFGGPAGPRRDRGTR